VLAADTKAVIGGPARRGGCGLGLPACRCARPGERRQTRRWPADPGNVVLRYQRFLDRQRAPLGEIQIVGVSSNIVGVSFHHQLPVRIVLQCLRYLPQHGRGFRLQRRLGKIEVNAVGDGALLLRQLLLQHVIGLGDGKVDLHHFDAKVSGMESRVSQPPRKDQGIRSIIQHEKFSPDMRGTVARRTWVFALTFKRSRKMDCRQSYTLIVDDHGVVHVVRLNPGQGSRLVSGFHAVTHIPDIHIPQVELAALLDRLKCGVRKTSAGNIMQKPRQAMRINGNEGASRTEVGIAVLIAVSTRRYGLGEVVFELWG
jgi:hypothetical protein